MKCHRHDELMKKNVKTGLFICSSCNADPFLTKQNAEKLQRETDNDPEELNFDHGGRP